MAAIVWDKIGDRVYESGLDRGVLYFPDGGGVPWNGLISVDEKVSTKIEPIYFDGVKFNHVITVGDFEGVLSAYTYPDEFLEYEGIIEDQTGILITGQPQKKFHLSYRTKIGNDVDGFEHGYKIHLLWNLIAIPSTKSYETLTLDTEPSEFEWSLSSIPEDIERYKPTAHVIIDTRRMDPLLISDIEDVLYGTSGDEPTEPTLPSLKGLSTFIRKWNRIIIVDNGDGTWSAITKLDSDITMLDANTFQINNANAIYLDANTYEISSSEKNEEDIF